DQALPFASGFCGLVSSSGYPRIPPLPRVGRANEAACPALPKASAAIYRSGSILSPRARRLACSSRQTLMLGSCVHITEDPVQDRDQLLDLARREGQPRHEAQRVRSRRMEHQPCLERLRCHLGSDRFAKGQGLQQAAAAYLPQPVAFRKLGKRSREHFPFRSDAIQKFLLRHLAEHSETCGTHQRVAVECATLIAMCKAARAFGCKQRCKRHSATQSFAEGQDVRLDPNMLLVEHLSGAAVASLDLIEDQ